MPTDEEYFASSCRALLGESAPPDDPDGEYRCPRMICTRRSDLPSYCGLLEEPLAPQWRVLVVIAPPRQYRTRRELERWLPSAPGPLVRPSRSDRPLVQTPSPVMLRGRAGGPVTVVAGTSGSPAETVTAVRRRLERGDAVVLVTDRWEPGDRLDGWPVRIIDLGLMIETIAHSPGSGSNTGDDDRYELDPPPPVTRWPDTGDDGFTDVFEDIWPDTEAAPVRHVNVAPRWDGDDLLPGQDYRIRVGIGPRVAESVLQAFAPEFPVRHLTAATDGWWLQAVLSDGGTIVGHAAFFLPRESSSFVCPCRPGRPHTCTEAARQPWLELGVRAPTTPGLQDLQLAIHLGAAAVQTFQILVPVGLGGYSRPTATAAFTLSTDLERLERFDGRTVSIRSGGHALVVKTATGEPTAFTLTDDQAGTAARGLRAVLYDRQLETGRRGLVSRYDAGLAKGRDDYLADLLALAHAGAEAYAALLPSWQARDALTAALSGSAGPPVIQIAQAEGSRPVIPWQLVYDEPIVQHAGDPAVCPSVWEFGPGAPVRAVPDRCPYAAGHGVFPGTVCPFGFWGLANVLEVPPSSRWLTLAEVTGTERPPSVVVALDPSLADESWETHRATLDLLGVPRRSVVTTDLAGMRAAVLDGADLLYFLCHGRRVPGAGTAEPGLALDLGRGGRLTPQDVTSWAGLRPRVRWTQRRPFVVLNGCHTGERVPETLTDFASAFVEATGAAGVLVTEITLERRLACHIMDVFVAAWGAGEGVGAALRRTRWDLLRRGNVMGLAYSPYCDADLRLPRPERLPA